MSRSPKTQQRPWWRFFALVIPTLAYWQLRRAWFLLLFITLGLIAAVVVTCGGYLGHPFMNRP
jgi:hypothetical protein